MKVRAAKESEERIETAKKQAAGISERTQQEFAWRKQQLRRETELLHERKRAVLHQLASLSALAEETAQSFPELEDPAEMDREQGDQTVLRPSNLNPTLPKGGPAAGQKQSSDSTKVVETRAPAKPETSTGEPEVDGDATIRATSDTPAGAQHLAGKADNKNS